MAILLDTKGPEIRTGKLKDSQEIDLKEGQEFTFFSENSGRIGDADGVTTTYPCLAESVKIGDSIMVDDGLLSFRVIELGFDWVKCRLENSGRLGETKGINLPGNKVIKPKARQSLIIFVGKFTGINRKGPPRHSVWYS